MVRKYLPETKENKNYVNQAMNRDHLRHVFYIPVRLGAL